MSLTKKSIYISLFAILYLIVAFSSLYHAVEFFGLANNLWMAIILAFAFEVGQAAVLFALLTSNKDRGKVMPWVLMTMFTLVQVLGNVYSSYKHIINNSTDNLRYFKEPIFIWTQLPDDQATVIITYLVGGLLPVSALLLTSMVTNYLTDDNKNNEIINDETEKEIDNNTEKDNETNNNYNDKSEEEIIEKTLENDEKTEEETIEGDMSKMDVEDEDKYDVTDTIEIGEIDEIPIEKPEKLKGTDPDGGVIGELGEDGSKYIKEIPKKESHFINLK